MLPNASTTMRLSSQLTRAYKHMKRILFGMGAVLLLCLFAEPTQAQHESSASAKTWIFLTDKLDAAGKTTVAQAGYVTDRARQRRLKRGSVTSPSLDAPVSPAHRQQLEDLGITTLHESRWLNAVTARLTPEQEELVAALPFVRDLKPVAMLSSASSAPAMPLVRVLPTPQRTHTGRLLLDYGESRTQLDVINAIPALERGINGSGVVIGFVDTRFDDFSGRAFGHRALAHLADSGRVTMRDFTLADQADTGSNQSNRHGVSVASVAVGYESGELIGPGYGVVEVYAAITEFAPFERNVEEDNFVAGLEWLESEGVDVVNSSLGYSTFDSGQHSYTTADMDGNTGLTTIACDLAVQMGVVVVVSAGNAGNGSWGIITTPADGDSVLAVGGIDPNGQYVSFSSRGPTADGRIKPDVSAVGAGVYVAGSGGGYGFSGGTSFASPIVAGVATQMLQANDNLEPWELMEVLRGTASQKDSPDIRLGWGIIDADAAIAEAERCKDPAIACLQPVRTATERAGEFPEQLQVRSPYPNPFTDTAHFDIDIPHASDHVRVTLYNMLGQRVDVPFAGPLSSGTHTVTVNGASLSPGLYVYTVENGGRAITGKVTLVR